MHTYVCNVLQPCSKSLPPDIDTFLQSPRFFRAGAIDETCDWRLPRRTVGSSIVLCADSDHLQAFSETLGLCINCARRLDESGMPSNPVHQGLRSWSSRLLAAPSLLDVFVSAQHAASSGCDFESCISYFVCVFSITSIIPRGPNLTQRLFASKTLVHVVCSRP
jgi:hypothetical protein